MRRLLLFLFATIWLASHAFGADRLFFVSRNLNRNIIVYDVQLKNGALDINDPIHVYWYNQEHNPVTTNELNFIQRKLAYGYSVVKKGTNEVSVKLKAYGKRDVKICKRDGKWVAQMTINGKECILSEIYAHCPSKTSCDYVEIIGKCIQDGTLQKERVKG